MACYLLTVILLQTFAHSEGLQWIMETSQITKCVGQSAHITWKYIKEDNQEIRQHQWYFNSSVVIATSSVSSGFVVEPSYKERVEKYGETGILLKNVSTADTGSYTLYPRVAWEKSPSIFSIFLNITERSTDNSCTCERMPEILQGKINIAFKIEIDGCYLQINSSFCCPIGSALECYEGDPNKLCIIIPNQEKQTTVTGTGTVGITTMSAVTYQTDIENSASYHLLRPLRDIVIVDLVVCILQFVIVTVTCVFIVLKHYRILGTTMSGKKLHTSTPEMVQSGPWHTEEFTGTTMSGKKLHTSTSKILPSRPWHTEEFTGTTMSGKNVHTATPEMVQSAPWDTDEFTGATMSVTGTTISGKKVHTSTPEMVRSGPQDTDEYTAMCGENLPFLALNTKPLRARDTEKNKMTTPQQYIETFKSREHGDSESSF